MPERKRYTFHRARRLGDSHNGAMNGETDAPRKSMECWQINGYANPFPGSAQKVFAMINRTRKLRPYALGETVFHDPLYCPTIHSSALSQSTS